MPTSTLVEGKGKGGNTWDIYIYTMVEMGMMMPGQWYIFKRIYYLPSFFPFFLRKVTTMHYLPAW